MGGGGGGVASLWCRFPEGALFRIDGAEFSDSALLFPSRAEPSALLPDLLCRLLTIYLLIIVQMII